MNIFILIAAILSFLAIIGHFGMGSKLYMIPILHSDLEEVPKHVMRSLFHYMSVYLIVSSYVLFEVYFNLGLMLMSNAKDVLLFIGIIYAGLAIVQIIIALISGIKSGLLKLFQWIFWLLISLSIFIGI